MNLPLSPSEPLVLADGTKIDPSTGKEIRDIQRFVEIPSAHKAQEIVARARRSVAELPLPSSQMNAVSLCLMYTMWGLSDADIAIVCKLTIPQIKNIKKLDEYKKLQDDLRKSVLEVEATNVREFFEQRALGAAKKIVTIAEEEEGALGFKASQDILDRAGFRPADTVHHKHSMDEPLRIEYTTKKQASTEDTLTIDVEYEEVN